MNQKSALAAVLIAALTFTMSITASAGTYIFYPDSESMTTDFSEFTDQDLADYADQVFQLVNLEREKTGAAPLAQSEYLSEAASTRAMDCASVNSLYINGKPHTRPDGSLWFTVFGIANNYNYGENAGQGGPTADIQMLIWMESASHKANLLRKDYTEIGIGCAVSEQGEIFTVQLFYRP